MIRFLPFLMLCVLFLPGCSTLGIATGVGASAGIAAAQEGGISRAVDDARIQLEINDLWFRYDVETFRKLDLTINQGRVLITGVVQDPEKRVEAVRLAWQPRGVEQVINEIQVADSDGIFGFAKDTWITGRIRAALTLDRNVNSINYSIDTVKGTVYLMGFAQNREELNRVIETARTINSVNGVVSYVKFVGGGESVTNGSMAMDQPYQDTMVVSQPAPLTGYEPQNTYPNNAPSADVYRSDEPIVIRRETLNQQDYQGMPNDTPTPPPPVQRQSIESETILWDG